jgi:hypothetical protein
MTSVLSAARGTGDDARMLHIGGARRRRIAKGHNQEMGKAVTKVTGKESARERKESAGHLRSAICTHRAYSVPAAVLSLFRKPCRRCAWPVLSVDTGPVSLDPLQGRPNRAMLVDNSVGIDVGAVNRPPASAGPWSQRPRLRTCLDVRRADREVRPHRPETHGFARRFEEFGVLRKRAHRLVNDVTASAVGMA